MREILFKAKRLDNEEWVEGNLIQTTYFGEVRSWISTPSDPTRLRAISTYYGDWRAVEVHTDTLCQYTGLTDKNGNKIWENDIVKMTYRDNDYEIGLIRYDAEDVRYRFCVDDAQYCFDRTDTTEVIGNIFDNADLLQ